MAQPRMYIVNTFLRAVKLLWEGAADRSSCSAQERSSMREFVHIQPDIQGKGALYAGHSLMQILLLCRVLSGTTSILWEGTATES